MNAREQFAVTSVVDFANLVVLLVVDVDADQLRGSPLAGRSDGRGCCGIVILEGAVVAAFSAIAIGDASMQASSTAGIVFTFRLLIGCVPVNGPANQMSEARCHPAAKVRSLYRLRFRNTCWPCGLEALPQQGEWPWMAKSISRWQSAE
jgi:hypothetical protein